MAIELGPFAINLQNISFLIVHWQESELAAKN